MLGRCFIALKLTAWTSQTHPKAFNCYKSNLFTQSNIVFETVTPTTAASCWFNYSGLLIEFALKFAYFQEQIRDSVVKTNERELIMKLNCMRVDQQFINITYLV